MFSLVFFNSILGEHFHWTRRLNLHEIGLPSLACHTHAAQEHHSLSLGRRGHGLVHDDAVALTSSLVFSTQFSIVGDGESTFFWLERWISMRGSSASWHWPSLPLFGELAVEDPWLTHFLAERAWVGDLTGALPVQVLLLDLYIHISRSSSVALSLCSHVRRLVTITQGQGCSGRPMRNHGRNASSGWLCAADAGRRRDVGAMACKISTTASFALKS